MSFCGQCGLQLAPGMIRCPRCGASVEPDVQGTATIGEYEPNAPTTQSPSLLARQQSQPGMPAPAGPPTPQDQQKMVLPPVPNGSSYGYRTQTPYDATTRRSERPEASMGSPYPSYPGATPQNGGSYPSVNTTAGADYQQYPAPYPNYQAAQAGRKAKGRTVALALILLGLLFILTAVVLFTLQHNGTIAIHNTGGSTTVAAATPGLTRRAPALIQHYYDDINNKNYGAAYHLWKPGAIHQSFADFANGFSRTLHDQVTITNVTEQSGGTVKVSVTLHATEAAPSNTGTQQNTYQGYYLVEQQPNGTLAILQGSIQQV